MPFQFEPADAEKEELVRFGGFDEMSSQAEDWHLLTVRIMRHGYCFLSTGYDGVGYRNTPGSMVRRNAIQHVANSSALIESAQSDEG